MSKSRKKSDNTDHITFHKNEKFISLQKKWYKKLEKAGFEDCEWLAPNGEVGNYFTRNSTGDLRRSFSATVETYYAMARNYACHGTFTSKLDHFIWSEHSQGTPYRDISSKLLRKYRKPEKHLHYSTICLRVQRMRQEMFEFERSNAESLTFNRELFDDEDSPEQNKCCL